MSQKDDELHTCAHCSGSGTCKTGSAGESCAVCVKKNELRKGTYTGLACGTCGGLGKTDSFTYRITHRTQPALAIILVVIPLFLIGFFSITESQYFHEILAFCTTVIGSVTGFYFSTRARTEAKS